MTAPSTSSVFLSLGYQVLSLDRGVYVLKRDSDEPCAVALLLARRQQLAPALPATLFIEPVPEDVAVVDIVEVWQNLDARRFEETGLVGTPLELGPLEESDIEDVAYDRPDGGVRLAAVLSTGDVVCFC